MKNKFQFIYFQRYLGLVAYTIAVFVLILLTIRFFFISPGRVNGRSMEPNYTDEKFFFVNKSVYLFASPEKFDVVQVIEPESEKLIIKRIIGLPGETIIIKRGRVYIKNQAEEVQLDESLYLDKMVLTRIVGQSAPLEFTLKDNEYFVVGDNRDFSMDSRHYGPIHRKVIVGKVI